MNAAVMDCMVTGHTDLVAGLTLPDPNDRHVLAAAIKSGSDAIVTFNKKDFPGEYLAQFDVEVLHPDDFILHQFGLDDAKVIIAAQRCRARLRNPPSSEEEYLERLERQSLPQTVAELRRYTGIL
jgi:hypothetical protein